MPVQQFSSIQQGHICSLPWTAAWELPPLCPSSARDDNPALVTCLKPSFHTYCAAFSWLRQDSSSGPWYSTMAESRHLHMWNSSAIFKWLSFTIIHIQWTQLLSRIISIGSCLQNSSIRTTPYTISNFLYTCILWCAELPFLNEISHLSWQ